MFKKYVLPGAVSGVLAGTASVIYQKVYATSLGADFITVVKPVNIMVASVAAGLIAGVVYPLLQKLLKRNAEIVFNLAFVLLSFASIVAAFGAKLPIDIDMPELFPGLVVPMHFFPALAWLTLKPVFIKQAEPYKKVFA